MLSGQGSENIAAGSIKSGASDYLVKSKLNMDILVRTLRHCMEKKHSETALKEQYHFLETLIGTIPNPVFYMNTSGIYLGCNKAFEESMGLSKDRIIGSTVYDVYSPDQADLSHEMDLELFRNPGVQSYEGRVRYADGMDHDIVFNKATFTDIQGSIAGLVGVMLDITDRKSLEEHLKRSKDQLEHTMREMEKANRTMINQNKSVVEEERLKLLLQLSGAAAHELNNPLASLLGTVELLRLKGVPDLYKHSVDIIEASANKIADVVKKIQLIRRDEVKSYIGNTMITNLDQDIHILFIGGSDDDYNKIRSILEKKDSLDLVRAKTIDEARSLLSHVQFDLVLIDSNLHDADTMDLLGMEGKDVALVVITGKEDTFANARLIQVGASDYLSRDTITIKSLSRIIGNTMEKQRLKKEVDLAMTKMAQMATRDDLTGLYNRRYFIEALEREYSRALRFGEALSLCMMDIDRFSDINNTYGHHAGDHTLSEMGKILQSESRKSDLACRYGGEEFAMIFTNTDIRNARTFCNRFQEHITSHPIEYNTMKIAITVSMGITAMTKQDIRDMHVLIKKADHALYSAKSRGRNQILELT